MSLGLISLLPVEDLRSQDREKAAMMVRLVGDSTAIQVLAHSRPATDFYYDAFYKQMFYNQNQEMKVEVRLKQLLRLRLSKRNGCALCNRSNEEEVLRYGFNKPQIDALNYDKLDHSVFTEAECSVIEFADQMVMSNPAGILDARLYEKISRHLSDEQIVELAMVAAVLVGRSKLDSVLNIVPREATCSILVRPVGVAVAAEA